jgi:DNA-binding NtrC family response regulator
MKRSILYLDDEDMCLRVFQDMFRADYDVRVTSSLKMARGELAARPADIIISDQHMPDIEGTDFLREVAEDYPASYRVLLTGEIMIGHVMSEVSTGIIHLFIPKPWDEPQMRQMLEHANASFERQ